MTTLSHPKFSTLVQALRYRAEHEGPSGVAYIYLNEGANPDDRISYRELDRRARAIAASLQRLAPRGARAVLIYPPDLSYVAGFFGCLYAGLIPVPAYPPDPGRLNRTLPRLQAIFADADAGYVLTTAEIAAMAQFLFAQAPDLEAKAWVATDSLEAGTEDNWAAPTIAPADVAFLQYTSGSTGAPKGVILTHDNLIHNLDLISVAFDINERSVGVSWLPPYHDMGLIGGILAPLYKGRPTALMSPVAFLRRPLRWLEAITRYRATISGGPNFAYDLCVRKVTPSELEGLDLRSWRIAFTGAEPVRSETLDSFVRMFGPRNFRRSAFYPCYGLAEATLIVSGGRHDAEPIVETIDADGLQSDRVVRAPAGDISSKRVVGCGHVLGDQELAVVNPGTFELALPGDVGEIWVRGRSVAAGYWRRPDATEEVFDARVARTSAGPFLRTGDLGFLRDGELFVTGRIKDLVIIRGRNYYPQDIERTAEASHPSLRRGCCAAFAAELQGQERLIVAVEIERRFRERRRTPSSPPEDSGERRASDRRAGAVRSVEEAAKQTSSLGADRAGPFDPDDVCAAIRRAVLEQHELNVHEVVLVTPGAIPKTSSGKIQRAACRQAFLDGSLEHVASSVFAVEQTRRTSIQAGDLRDVVVQLQDGERRAWLEQFLKDQLAKALKTPVSRVDPTRSLSTFGLDSLLAVDLAHRIEKRLGVVAATTAFLRDTTIKDLAASIDAELTREPRSAVLPSLDSRMMLSAGQEALWFLHQLASDNGAYNLSCAFRVVSELDVEILRASFEHLITRHEALRTTYSAVNGAPVRRVLESPEIDFSCSTQSDSQQADLASEAVQPFDIERGPLVRVRVRAAPVGAVVQVVMHHIAVDLWSVVVLLNELGIVYEAIRDRRPVPLKAAKPDYSDFIRWQRDYLSTPAGAAARDHWRLLHAKQLPLLSLPTDRPRPAAQTYRGASCPVPFEADVVGQLRELARLNSTTLYVVLLSGLALLLMRCAAQKEIVIGSPVAGRPRAEFDRTVGYFVNVLPLRIVCRGTETFAELIASVRARVLDALENQHYPLSHIVEQLGLARDPALTPLFQACLAMEKAPRERDEAISNVVLGLPGSCAKVGGLAIEAVSIEDRSTQFDLTLTVVEGRASMAARIQYNVDLFDHATVARMAEHLRALLVGALERPTGRVGELDYLTVAEVRALSAMVEGPSRMLGDQPVHALVVARGRQSPDSIAITEGDKNLSYGQLTRMAARVAGWLHRERVGGRGRTVALRLPRSIEMVVAQLAILQAGAAYVPVDPSTPEDRFRRMVHDACAAVVFMPPSDRSEAPSARVGEVLGMTQSSIAADGDTPLEAVAYLIYTSGSTGEPKGVAVPHRGLLNLVEWHQRAYGVREEDRSTVLASPSFDASAWELWPYLSAGSTLVIVDDAIRADPRALVDLLAERQVTAAFMPTPLAEIVVRAERMPAPLRFLHTGGDRLRRGPEGSASFRFMNHYGPTEYSVVTTAGEVSRGGEVPSIGLPVDNTRAEVLGAWFDRLPTGCAGELYIGGPGLAQGYWCRPADSAERFVPDPSGGPGVRMYKTGDIVRRGRTGELAFVGRMDSQVKVRGFRIELGEIEVALLGHPRIREAIVRVQEPARGERQLVAYVTLEPGADAPTQAELSDHLRPTLPDYMIPSGLVVLAAFPFLASGKIDARSLPTFAVGGSDYIAPRSPLEEEVSAIVCEILGLSRVSVTSNFFEMGGHSLSLAQVANRIRSRFEEDVTLAELFENPTVAGMALAVATARAAAVGADLSSILEDVESLSPEELDRLLQEKVKLG